MSNSLLSHPSPTSTSSPEPEQLQEQTINNLFVSRKLVTGGVTVFIPVPAADAINGSALAPNVMAVTPHQLLSGCVIVSLLPNVPTSNITVQLPTAAAMVSAMQGQFGNMGSPAGGASFGFTLINPSAFQVQPEAAAGFSLGEGVGYLPPGSVAAPSVFMFQIVVTVPTAGSAACVLLSTAT